MKLDKRKPNPLYGNAFVLAFSNGLSALLSFGLLIVLGQGLGVEGLGVYSAALAWVYPLSLLSEAGMGTLITRQVAQAPSSARAYADASALARLIVGGALVLVLIMLAPILSQDSQVVLGIRLSAPLIVINPLYSTLTALLRAHQIMRPIAGLNVGMLVAQVGLTLAVLLAGAGVQVALVLNLLTSLGQMLTAYAVVRGLGLLAPTGERVAWWALWRAAFPFALAALLAAIQARLALWMLEAWGGAGAVGLYVAAVRWNEAGRLLPFGYFDALFPRLAQLRQDERELERVFGRAWRALALYGVAWGLVLSLCAPLLLPVFGAEFGAAVSAAQWAGWALLPLALKSLRIIWHYAHEREMAVNRRTLVGVVLYAGLCAVLIPAGGVQGAVLALVLGEGVQMALVWRVK